MNTEITRQRRGGIEKCGASRFHVLYSQPRGSKRQRAWQEGSLKVSFAVATLFDIEERCVVTSQHGSGLLPNKVFQRMKDARGGLDWDPRRSAGGEALAEVWVGPNYLVQIMEVMELHLLPYEAFPPVPNPNDGAGGVDGDKGVLLAKEPDAPSSARALVPPPPRLPRLRREPIVGEMPISQPSQVAASGGDPPLTAKRPRDCSRRIDEEASFATTHSHDGPPPSPDLPTSQPAKDLTPAAARGARLKRGRKALLDELKSSYGQLF